MLILLNLLKMEKQFNSQLKYKKEGIFMCSKCEKCGCSTVLVLIEREKYLTTEIYRCTNLRCGYIFRILKPTK